MPQAQVPAVKSHHTFLHATRIKPVAERDAYSYSTVAGRRHYLPADMTRPAK